ncbi:hypothetical protein P9112_010591 [Eukaryota sp. TZLM1-RC]
MDLASLLGGMSAEPQTSAPDTSETLYISSLALLKMLKHGRAGVPMEVMGLMLGEFVDEYTVRITDVFAMPQSGTAMSVEAIDSAFQQQMMEMLKRTGRSESVVGWYHSHPGFGCWLSSVDVNTQQSMEQLDKRAIAVVVDPIQSVKGKVVIDAFRTISPQTFLTNQESRQTTSNVGGLMKPNISALIRGLGRQYYNMVIDYRKSEYEQDMLLNMGRTRRSSALRLNDFGLLHEKNKASLNKLSSLAKEYCSRLSEEMESTPKELEVKNVGKTDPKRALENECLDVVQRNMDQTIGSCISTCIY